MNFLELCQQTALDCGVSGTISSVTGQVGSLNRIVGWVQRAWREIQTAHEDWDWMRSSNLLGAGASFATVSGTYQYPLGTGAGTCGVLAANFGKWDPETFRCYTTSLGQTGDEMIVDVIKYDQWRNGYMIGSLRSERTRPYVAAVAPNKAICLGPPPNALYTITADYFVAPSAMEEDDDEPTGLPAAFQDLIIYKAMQYYGAYESAPEVKAEGIEEFDRLYARLESKYAPEIDTCGALA